ncbi:MAG: hypothetical protein ACI9F9_000756 [Candidatus Paceibacteria bacterium]|jgi:hypothetical protein
MLSEARAEIKVIRELLPSDEARALAAFNGVNGALDDAFDACSEEEWRWRYVNHPVGVRCMLGLDEAGEVLAQYAGLPQTLSLDGELTSITQGVDSFSTPRVRGLGKRGAFVLVGEEFAGRYGGSKGAGDPWMWGFPVRTARRVGERFLGYSSLRAQPLLELCREPRSLPGCEAVLSPWGRLEEVAGDLNVIFKEQSQLYPALADRRVEALRWRYANHPKRRYQLLLQESPQGEVSGYAVVTLANIAGKSVAVLCDGAAYDERDGGLLRAAWRYTTALRRQTLVCALPPWSAAFSRYQEFGFRVRSSELLMVGRSYDRDYPAEFWRSSWYTTLGDTDLC